MTLTTSSPTWRSGSGAMLPGSRPGDVDTEKKMPLGTIMKFRDPNLGEGEFIYLAGASSTVAGDAVSYNTASWTTTRAAAGAGVPWTIAWATAAVDANTKYGWYQISGQVLANKTITVSLAAGIAVGISTTALVIHSSSLKELQGAWVSLVSSASTAVNGTKVQLTVAPGGARLQGRIT